MRFRQPRARARAPRSRCGGTRRATPRASRRVARARLLEGGGGGGGGGARLGDVRRVDERRERVGAHKAFFRIGFRKRSVFPEQLAQTREARDGGAARRDAPRDVGARARPVGAFARGARLEDGIRHDVVRLEVRRRGPFRGVQERRAGDAVFRRAPCRRAPPRLREHGVALNLEKRRRRVRQHVAPLEHERVPQPRDALAGQRVGAELGEPPRAQQAGAHARVRAGFRRVRQLPRHRLVEGEALGEQTGVAREKKPGRDVLGEARQHPEALLLILRHKQQNAGDRARRRAVPVRRARGVRGTDALQRVQQAVVRELRCTSRRRGGRARVAARAAGSHRAALRSVVRELVVEVTAVARERPRRASRRAVRKRAPRGRAREAGVAREGALGVAARVVARRRRRLVARAAVQVRLVGHGARVALAVRVERLAPHVAAVQGVHALEREAQPRLAAGSARLGSSSLSRVRARAKKNAKKNVFGQLFFVFSSFSFARRRRGCRDSKGVSARARADGGRTLYASSAVSCFARAAGNVTRISSYLRVARGGRRVRTASGRRAHEARPLGDDRKMSDTRTTVEWLRVARAAKRRKRVVSSDEADELRTGTHRGESQSGMGKPSESYSAPPVDEVEVAETSQASAAAISDRRVAGAVARTRRAHREKGVTAREKASTPDFRAHLRRCTSSDAQASGA